MPLTDDRTPNLDLPLPHAGNNLDVDVVRLRDALSALDTAFALLAPLANPALTGSPTAPTAATGTNTTQVATTAFVQATLAGLASQAYVQAQIAALVSSSPAALDTLNELATALGNDPNFATTITNALAGKQASDATLTALAGLTTAANQIIYATAADTFATTALTAFARSLLDDTDAATMRGTLGLGAAALLAVGTAAGTVAAGDHSHAAYALAAALGSAAYKATGSSGDAVPLCNVANTWDQKQTFSGGIDIGSQFAFRNKIIGHFGENQRAATSVADDTYCADRWYVLTESGNVTVAQVTDPESGAPYGYRLSQPDASAKRMGLATIIESNNIRALRSTAMNFFMRVKPSFSGNVRYAILEHAGTADTVTSDVVNNWASTTFTAGNFFIAGLNVIKTGTVAPGAATYGEFSDYGVMGASLNNAILFVWTEDQVPQNATLELNRPQFEPGVIHTQHEWRMNELSMCKRYYYRWTTGGAVGTEAGVGYGYGTTNANIYIPFPVEMRARPAALEQSGTASDYRVLTSSAVNVCTSVPVFQSVTLHGARCGFTVASGISDGQCVMAGGATAAAYLGFSAEL